MTGKLNLRSFFEPLKNNDKSLFNELLKFFDPLLYLKLRVPSHLEDEYGFLTRPEVILYMD